MLHEDKYDMIQIYLFAAEELWHCKEKRTEENAADIADMPGRDNEELGKTQAQEDAAGLPGWDKLTRRQQEKVSCCKQDKARRLCLSGQLLLQYAANASAAGRFGWKSGRELQTDKKREHNRTIRLQQLTGRQLLSGIPAPLPLEIAYGPKGKPYIAEEDWHFNLSHSGGYAALAISDAPVGIDIQKIGPYRASLARRFFAAEEAEACERLISSDMPGKEETAAELLYTLWCRKEAYGKLKGTGLTADVLKRNMLKDMDVHFEEYPILPDYRICVCSEEGHCRDEEAVCIFEGLQKGVHTGPAF